MKLTAQISYAYEALLDIAERYGDKSPVNLHDISERHKIPEKYLLQVMVKLKHRGFVSSRRGSGGGFQLAMAPSEINLADIVRTLTGGNAAVGENQKSALPNIWRKANAAFLKELEGHTLGNLLESRSKA